MTHNPYRYLKTSRDITQLAVMVYMRFPLSLRNVEDLLHEAGYTFAMSVSGSELTGLDRSLQSKSDLGDLLACADTLSGSGSGNSTRFS
jgi:hypothetical protein